MIYYRNVVFAREPRVTVRDNVTGARVSSAGDVNDIPRTRYLDLHDNNNNDVRVRRRIKWLDREKKDRGGRRTKRALDFARLRRPTTIYFL